MAIELKNGIEERYGVEIPIADLIKGASITELAGNIAERFGKRKDEEEFEPVEIDVTENYTLSYGQNAMWFQHQLAPSSIFNPTYAVKISEDVNIEKLKDSINIVVERHSALRTRFKFFDGQPVQNIDPAIKPNLEVIECVEKSDAEIIELVQSYAEKVFEIERGEVFRIMLFKRESDSVLFIATHHIAVDYWSMATLVNEIGILYGSENDVKLLRPSKYSYIDFINWQVKIRDFTR
jgi:hypothetical protein